MLGQKSILHDSTEGHLFSCKAPVSQHLRLPRAVSHVEGVGTPFPDHSPHSSSQSLARLTRVRHPTRSTENNSSLQLGGPIRWLDRMIGNPGPYSFPRLGSQLSVAPQFVERAMPRISIPSGLSVRNFEGKTNLHILMSGNPSVYV